VRWAETSGITDALALAAGRMSAAAEVAARVESFLPSDDRVRQLWTVIAREITIDTVPQGAVVFRKPFDAPDTPWEPLGRTPLAKVRVPRGPGRWRIEKPGFAAIEGSLTDTADGTGSDRLRVPLDRLEDAPPGMVRVPGGTTARLDLFGYDALPPRVVPDFWIDRHEVTNRQFKLFIDAGGYQQRDLWTQPILRAGTALTWREAVAELRDASGQPGPSGWDHGTFPPDQAEHPVAGVSWYEAAAYCASAGKQLPTVWQWNSAAGIRMSASVVPASNFSGRGPTQVGRLAGLGPWGTYDMAGNVKEWSATPAASGQRYALGGGWNEPAQGFHQADIKAPLLRLANLGLRCVKPTSGAEPVAPEVMASIAVRDYDVERPSSDDLFRFFKSLHAYERAALNARTERVEERGSYRAERVSFDAADTRQRVSAYLLLPAGVSTGLQTVVYWPGAETFHAGEPATLVTHRLLKSGRAVLIPALKRPIDQRDGSVADAPDTTPAYRDRLVLWGRDLRRSVDYLQTRPEIDMTRLAYYGSRLGARLGPIISVVEERLRVNVWAHGGLKPQRSLPEADSFHFAPRVRVPTLLVGGRYDFEYPLERAQLPLFRALRLPADQKRHVVVEARPVPSREEIEITLDWLDRHLGRPR
jgi:dienelactone hydrolase